MAKISFTKLGLTKNTEVKTVEFNGQNIEVKQYLPIKDKIKLVENIVNNCKDEEVFWNPIKVDLWTKIEIFSAYTNITITEKQKEDYYKLYDLIAPIYNQIKNVIPQSEIDFIDSTVYNTMDSVYKYKNSALGILNVINENYNALQFDTQEIEKTLGNSENFSFVKEIMDKMG